MILAVLFICKMHYRNLSGVFSSFASVKGLVSHMIVVTTLTQTGGMGQNRDITKHPQ